MNISIHERVQRTVFINLTDGLDARRVPDFHQKVDPYLHEGVTDFVVDLTNTTFLDSAGMAALVSLLRRCRRQGGDVHLVRPQQKSVRRILDLTRFDKVFVMLERSLPSPQARLAA